MSITRLLPLLAASLFAACSVLPEHAPADTYLLPSAPGAAAPSAQTPPLPISLRVTTPAASLQLNSARIVVVPRENEISVYEGARWSEPAPVLVRNRLLDAFRADGRFASLSSDDRTLHADLELDGDLRAFQSEYRSGMPDVLIALNAVIVQTGTRRIVASRHFEIREKAAGTAVPQVVQAFGKAGDKLARDVVEWSVQQAAASK